MSYTNNDIPAIFIRENRKKAGLTIKEAAEKAKMTEKEWSRLEQGTPVPLKKYRSVCNAIAVEDFNSGNPEIEMTKSFYESLRSSPVWSDDLEADYGEMAAASLAFGLTILSGYIDDEMEQLLSMPECSHLGEIDSNLLEYLPEQFVTRYDYEFLYGFRCAARKIWRRVEDWGCEPETNSIAEDLVLVIAADIFSSMLYSEIGNPISNLQYVCYDIEPKIKDECEGCDEEDCDLRYEELDSWSDWVSDFVADEEGLIEELFSDNMLNPLDDYYFSNWFTSYDEEDFDDFDDEDDGDDGEAGEKIDDGAGD